ncbi:hypothetical protein ROJ8625_03900 [Roseivivax jejudonensis]|uniref:Uncharacterized protein n=1 Tax=Roseivivax jejudonensis TaxID=1529041 RepID=A0A1X7A8X0_9RHOB|nr:hypothetical protein [Roseivivax jejudonensis]SLN73236.1 hypothetical protein ROJ8625_03900 [Roseivivax jejudonensis]
MALYRMAFAGQSTFGAFEVAATVAAEDVDTAEARSRLAIYRAWTDAGHARSGDGAMPDLALTDAERLSLLSRATASEGVGTFDFRGEGQPPVSTARRLR